MNGHRTFLDRMRENPLGHGTLGLLGCAALAFVLVAAIGPLGGFVAVPLFAWLVGRQRPARRYRPDEQTRRWYESVTGHRLED